MKKIVLRLCSKVITYTEAAHLHYRLGLKENLVLGNA